MTRSSVLISLLILSVVKTDILRTLSNVCLLITYYIRVLVIFFLSRPFILSFIISPQRQNPSYQILPEDLPCLDLLHSYTQCTHELLFYNIRFLCLSRFRTLTNCTNFFVLYGHFTPLVSFLPPYDPVSPSVPGLTPSGTSNPSLET